MWSFIVCNAGAFLQCVLGRKREECKTVRFFSQNRSFKARIAGVKTFTWPLARSWTTQNYGPFGSLGRMLLVYVHSGVVHVTIFDFCYWRRLRRVEITTLGEGVRVEEKGGAGGWEGEENTRPNPLTFLKCNITGWKNSLPFLILTTIVFLLW